MRQGVLAVFPFENYTEGDGSYNAHFNTGCAEYECWYALFRPEVSQSSYPKPAQLLCALCSSKFILEGIIRLASAALTSGREMGA